MNLARTTWTLSAGLGWAWSTATPTRHQLARRQLDDALPNLEPLFAHRIVRRMFHHLAALPLEVLLAQPGHPGAEQELDLGPAGRLVVVGRHNLDAVLEAGRGALLLGAHLGNFELALLAEASRGLPVSVLSKSLGNPWLNDLWLAQRRRFGVEVLRDEHSLAHVLKALERRRCVAMTLDQHANREHAVPVRFFGRTAAAHRSLALISARADVPVVPAFARRVEPGVHELRYHPAMPFERGDGSIRQALQRQTQRYTDAIEAAVQRTPDQWTWLHRRWKADDAPRAEPATPR